MCAHGEHLHDALGHHLVVLGGSCRVASSGGQAESFTFSLKLGRCDLTIFRYDVDRCVQFAWKLGDLLSASMPTHAVAVGLQFRDVNHNAVGLPFKG